MHAACEALEHALEFAPDAAAHRLGKELADAVGAEQVEGEFTRPFKEAADRMVALEDKVVVILDLLQRPARWRKGLGRLVGGRAKRRSPPQAARSLGENFGPR